MHKVFHFIIELISWIAIFLSPTLLGGVIALFLYSFFIKNLIVLGSILFLFLLLGIFFAERVRKNHGCSKYLSRIYGW